MSYTPFKVVNIGNAGTATKYGSDNLDDITRILNGEVVLGRRPFIKNPWFFHDDTIGEIGHLSKRPSVKRSGEYIPSMIGSSGRGMLDTLIQMGTFDFGFDLQGFYHQIVAGVPLNSYNGLRSFYQSFSGYSLLDMEIGFTVPSITNRRVFFGFSTDQYMPRQNFPITAGQKGFIVGFNPVTSTFQVFRSDGVTQTTINSNQSVLIDVIQKLRIYTTVNDEFITEIDNQSGTVAFGAFNSVIPLDGDLLYFHFNIQSALEGVNPSTRLRYIQYESYL